MEPAFEKHAAKEMKAIERPNVLKVSICLASARRASASLLRDGKRGERALLMGGRVKHVAKLSTKLHTPA